MTVWHHKPKTIQFNGAPCVVHNWSADDLEFIEATKPRESFKQAYYAGGYRAMIGGVPTRLAAHVKSWSPWMKRALGRGALSLREEKEAEAQCRLLGLVADGGQK